jgi:hypothetical protein
MITERLAVATRKTVRKNRPAAAACRAAIAARPDFAHAHCNLGIALLQAGRADEALAAIETTVRYVSVGQAGFRC